MREDGRVPSGVVQAAVFSPVTSFQGNWIGLGSGLVLLACW